MKEKCNITPDRGGEDGRLKTELGPGENTASVETLKQLECGWTVKVGQRCSVLDNNETHSRDNANNRTSKCNHSPNQ